MQGGSTGELVGPDVWETGRGLIPPGSVFAFLAEHRRALDSTVLDDAVATQDTVTQLVAAVRRVIREVPGALQVVAAHCTAHDYAQAGKPKIAWNDQAARADLVDALVSDAHRLLAYLPEQQLGPAAAMGAGAARRAPRTTGSCPAWTPRPGTSTRTAPATRTATAPTSRSSRRPG